MTTRIFTLVAALCLLTVTAFAENAADIRRRMEQRLPAVDDLKGQQVIGENNHGFLEERKGGVAGASSVVAEENRDREAVYAILAKQTGATPESVGHARAKQIAANSRAGVWVQDESGKWSKK